jgi:TolB protein
MSRLSLSFLFLLFFRLTIAQPFTIDTSCQIISSPGDDLFPKWSEDGKQLLFQSNRDGNWDIFLFDFEKDSTIQLTNDPANEQHPEWLPMENQFVFNSDRDGIHFLYKMDLATGLTNFLFKRNIECRQASFPPTKRLVYFSGFNRKSEEWDIYSYDFVSDNLNHLTNLKGNCSVPVVSPNGKQILFQRTIHTYPYGKLAILNWYGKLEIELDSLWATDPSWSPNGLKIFFISGTDELQGEVYSIWKNGTHLERLTDDKLKVRTPAISPDGSKMALSVLNENEFDIFIISLDEY